MAERRASLQALTMTSPAAQARHLRCGRRLIDEHKPHPLHRNKQSQVYILPWG